MTRSLRAGAALLALAVTAPAAEPPQGRKDPQSTYEPRSRPGAGQKFLEKFVGDWDVAKAFYPRTGAPARGKGECRQRMEHGGRFLRSEFVFGEGPAKTTGTGLLGFEAESGTFTSVWVDSRSTRMSLRQSQGRFNGEEIVLFSRTPAADGKEARRSRTVTRLEDGGRKIVHRQYALAADGKERLMMELLLTRKAKAPAAAEQD
jgi:hypothetical protein